MYKFTREYYSTATDDDGSVEVDLRRYTPKSKGKTTLVQRPSKSMIAGKVLGQTLRGRPGTVWRHTTGEIPHGMTAVEEEIWKLQQKEKNK